MKLAILGSTRGTDAQHIMELIKNTILKDITIECIISNRSKSEIINKGKRFGIPSLFVSSKISTPSKINDDNNALMSREEYDLKLTKILEKYNIDYILLIGWMKILSKGFVERWKHKIINIHPSLLPAFEGGMDMNIHRAVIERGCTITGATLMFVDDGADTGPIIDQTHIRVLTSDTPEKLKEKVQQAEKDLFTYYLPLLRDGKIKVINNKVLIEQ